MAQNPPYVRLAERLTVGMAADTTSGWAISGNDVQPFPEDRDQARYVKRNLNAGILEPATEAEFEEVHPEPDEATEADDFVRAVAAAAGKGALPMQEAAFRRKVQEQHARARQVRRENTDDDDYEELDAPADVARDRLARREEERRAAILAQQEDVVSDDPEEQKERTATRPPAGAKTARKAKKSTKKAAAEDDE